MPWSPSLTRQLRADGHDIRRLDLGGGLGIPYERSNKAPPLPLEYGEVIKRSAIGDLGCEVEIEPGRLISGNAGIMVSEVIYVKSGEERNFLILDSRDERPDPAVDVWLLPRYRAGRRTCSRAPNRRRSTSSARSANPAIPSPEQRDMPPLAAGDLVAFRSAGAYGAVMASEYNSRPLIPEVHGAGRSIRCHTRPSDL